MINNLRRKIRSSWRRSPITFNTLLILLLVCSLKKDFLSRWRPRHFCVCVISAVVFLKKTCGWTILVVFLENTASCACLARSGLNDVFQWYAKCCICNKSLLRRSFSTTNNRKKEVSSTKSLTSDISSVNHRMYHNKYYIKIIINISYGKSLI